MYTCVNFHGKVKKWILFFGVNEGMTRSAEQTNRVHVFVPLSKLFPMIPDKKTLIPYINNASNKDIKALAFL